MNDRKKRFAKESCSITLIIISIRYVIKTVDAPVTIS